PVPSFPTRRSSDLRRRLAGADRHTARRGDPRGGGRAHRGRLHRPGRGRGRCREARARPRAAGGGAAPGAHPDAGAGELAQRRDVGRDPALRGGPPAVLGLLYRASSGAPDPVHWARRRCVTMSGMRIDHVSYAAESDGLVATAKRLAGLLGLTPRDGGIHPRFGTRNMILPLAEGRYVEVVEVLDHPAADKAPFGQAVRARSVTGGGWMGWVVAVDDLAPIEE